MKEVSIWFLRERGVWWVYMPYAIDAPRPTEWPRNSSPRQEVPAWDPSQLSRVMDESLQKENHDSLWKAATLQSLIDSLNGLFPQSSVNSMGGNSAIVDAAKTFEGTKYVWGWQGKEGIDCSGLVVEAMKLAGTPISDMTAADMQSKTPKITPAEAQPGDLLIWNDGKHVEIVVSATGNQVTTIWAASSRGSVSEWQHDISGKTIHKNTLWGAGGMAGGNMNAGQQLAA